MYILSYSFIIFKIEFVKNTDLPHSDGPVIIHRSGCFGYKIFSVYYIVFLLNKGLNNVYTIKDIKQISDIPHGMIVINGITISILYHCCLCLYNYIISYYQNL